MDLMTERPEGVGLPVHTDGFLRTAFIELWDKPNAKRGYPWASNPWVWVIEFQKVDA